MYFGIIEDKRNQDYVKHPLIDVLKLVLISILCGIDELEQIIDYGKRKIEFLRKEFEIESIPSKSTLTRIFMIIDPKWLCLSIVGILNSLIKEKHGQIMLDGKAIKSTDAIKTIKKMMNVVTAYTDTGISIYQKTVDSKSNEIPAVQELIQMINVEGKIVTADAMHCQKETAEIIVKNGGDYVLQLKANQKTFYEDVYAMFDEKYMDETDTECEYEIFSTIEKSHGRIEKRTCYVLNEIAYFTDYISEWKGLKKIFAVKREVERNGEKSTEISCYLSSKNTTAENLLSYTRNHWQIESMHHILDVTYNEDKCRLLSQKAQENLNIFRKIGISIHKQYLKKRKKSIRSNMFNCLIDDNYLLEVIGNITNITNL
jgi:predicted transposase YbfD/YdcC